MIAKFLACWRLLGPGLLMAGAAIGVSHLVQSTRAGASFGWQLLGVVLLINLLKYPFFEYGHRFTAATGRNLLEGYRAMGVFPIWLFSVMNTVAAVISVAAVTIVTAALAENLSGLSLGLNLWSGILFVVCGTILVAGRYRLLDRIIKAMMVVLVVSTVVAFGAALVNGPAGNPEVAVTQVFTQEGFIATLPFLIALMGWMPGPVEISAWQGLWIQARERQTGQRPSLREASIDFRVGYGLCVVLALLFLSLGALVMHRTGEDFAAGGAAFAGQVIQLYTTNLGDWSWPIISTAALMTMFSTTLTLVDAYPRSLAECTRLIAPRLGGKVPFAALHTGWVVLVCALALVLITGFIEDFKGLVDLATSVAFVAGTIFGSLTFWVLCSKQTPREMQPGPVLRTLSFAGIAAFAVFSVLFLWQLLG
ncbi:MAG: NRAMP family divalent metal transporter [Opitutales bacterium]